MKYNFCFPFITFKVSSSKYCISSERVVKILTDVDLFDVNNNTDFINGFFKYEEDILKLINLRLVFGFTSLKSEIDDFVIMKQNHIDWVKALEKSIKGNTEFTLTKDYDKCKFCLWYDNFKTDNYSLNFALSKIHKLHCELHDQAIEIDKLKAVGNKESINNCLTKALQLCEQDILPCLDYIIEVYNNINKGIVIVVEHNSCKFGVFVDSILSLENFSEDMFNKSYADLNETEYINGIFIKDDSLFYNICVDDFAKTLL